MDTHEAGPALLRGRQGSTHGALGEREGCPGVNQQGAESVCVGPLPTSLRPKPSLRPAGGRLWRRSAERRARTSGFRTGRGREVC